MWFQHVGRCVRRQKWILAAIVLLSPVIFMLARNSRPRYVDGVDPRASSTGGRDTYMDDVPEKLYDEVLKKWFHLSDGDKWFNRQNVSMRDPALLREMRNNWIIREYDPRKPYVLYSPELRDTSMGQARRIKTILRKKRNGFFIECGAYDGETRSNTLNLERFYGWTGILIEADPINFTKMLQKNRKAYLSPTCLSIKTRPVVASFLMARNVGRLHEPENSTEAKLKHGPDVAYYGHHVNVQCFPLASYMAALDIKTVDYFSLDIEGNELDVLETIPFDQVDIKTLSVEYIHNRRGRRYIIDMMDERGYYVHSFVEHEDNLANDIIFVKRDQEERLVDPH